MQYLILWSGQVRGAKQAVIGSERAHLVGHYVNGIPLAFNGAEFREALPARHKRAWDENRVRAWLSGDRPDSCWSIHVYGTRGNRLATYYAQPLTKEESAHG